MDEATLQGAGLGPAAETVKTTRRRAAQRIVRSALVGSRDSRAWPAMPAGQGAGVPQSVCRRRK